MGLSQFKGRRHRQTGTVVPEAGAFLSGATHMRGVITSATVGWDQRGRGREETSTGIRDVMRVKCNVGRHACCCDLSDGLKRGMSCLSPSQSEPQKCII